MAFACRSSAVPERMSLAIFRAGAEKAKLLCGQLEFVLHWLLETTSHTSRCRRRDRTASGYISAKGEAVYNGYFHQGPLPAATCVSLTGRRPGCASCRRPSLAETSLLPQRPSAYWIAKIRCEIASMAMLSCHSILVFSTTEEDHHVGSMQPALACRWYAKSVPSLSWRRAIQRACSRHEG
jgi:hypothetical protein